MAKKGDYKGKKSEKAWRDAIMVAVNDTIDGEDGKPSRALRVIASKVVKEAASGNMAAIQEIGNRLDGRPHQDVSVKAETTVTLVEEQVSRTVDWLGELTAARGAQTDKKPLPN